VFAEVVPLARARTLHTLRAVFGEAYPDPVRVVSVGQPVEALLSDPENANWMGLSVELCGGTHLKNTSQAARFALLEESSIAKGIRRIVAVTRDAAVAAHGRATELESDFAAARSLSGAALDARAAALKAALDVADIPAHAKAALRDALTELQKRVIAEAKAVAKKVEDEGKAAVAAAAGAALQAGRRFAVVAGLPIGADGNAIKAVSKAAADAAPALPVLCLSSNGADKVLVFAVVPPAATAAAGLKASEWVQSALAVAGGKSGGRDDSAQGTAKDVSREAAMAAAATAFAEGLLN